ncbi:MAG: hypothetical protein QOF47_3165 [Mycobacterium sp.]|jgi:hypothetical protein|nr:hypothetical protein [Mycobacterium sp.]
MSSTAEREELNELSGALLKCVTSLAAKCGDTPAVRRLVNDAERILNGVDRLDIDVEELELTRGHTPSVEMIQIPDTEYDLDFWRDVDHEGIGGQSGACDRNSISRSRR